jgi:hypothetical protein
MVRVTSNRRLYVFGFRLHHGLTGAVLAVLGTVLAVHDAADFPWRLRDR